MAEFKQYVNLDPKKSNELKEIKPERAGRIIKVKAKLNKKVEGVPVIFEIVSGKDNVVPSLDKSNFSKKQMAGMKMNLPGFVFPGKAKRRVLTDANGEAKIDFTLSSFGGDEFEVKAYVPKRGGKKGKELTSDKYIVWKRLYYQVSRFKGGKEGKGRKGVLPVIPNFDWGGVKSEYIDRKHNIELIDDSSIDLITRYKNILQPVDPYDDLKNSVKEGYDKKREPVTVRAVLVNMIATPFVEEKVKMLQIDRKKIDINVDSKLWIDESEEIGKDCIISAHIQFSPTDAKRKVDDVYMFASGPKTISIRFDLMDKGIYESSFGKDPASVIITLKLRYLEGSTNGLSWYNAIWIAHNSMHNKIPYTVQGKQNVVIHEVGHFIGMVDTNQTTWYKEHGHTGDHCSTGLSAIDKTKNSYRGLGGTCVMFGEGDGRAHSKVKFCGECNPSVRKSRARGRSNLSSM